MVGSRRLPTSETFLLTNSWLWRNYVFKMPLGFFSIKYKRWTTSSKLNPFLAVFGYLYEGQAISEEWPTAPYCRTNVPRPCPGECGFATTIPSIALCIFIQVCGISWVCQVLALLLVLGPAVFTFAVCTMLLSSELLGSSCNVMHDLATAKSTGLHAI